MHLNGIHKEPAESQNCEPRSKKSAHPVGFDLEK
jgi:hypothetical protein